MSEVDEGIVDLAVVGGGIAGLYVAWRALEGPWRPDSPLHARDGDHGRARVRVLEATPRIGGRLLTVTPPDAPDLRAELGGIAVLSDHRLVRGAVGALDLTLDALPGPDPNNLLLLRGRRFRAAEWVDADAVPYDLDSHERGRSPDQILRAAVARVVPDADQLDAAGWHERKPSLTHADAPLVDQGLWDVLQDLVSGEAFALMSDAGSFRPQFQNWNAAEAFADLAASWPAGSQAFRLRDGYEALPRHVATRVEAAGGVIERDRAVAGVSVEQRGADDVVLTLETTDGTRVRARRVVLALGHRALAGLVPETPLADDARIARALDSVWSVPLFHVFLLYASPWWQDLGITAGRSSTDLPLQSCFYFGSEADTGPAAGRSIVMVGYSAPDAIRYWDERGAAPTDGAPEPASDEMVADLSRQLAELHGTDVPPPLWAVRSDWRAAPYDGASHRWAVGARSWEIVPALRTPDPLLPVHVCGEAWSDDQGWVEGALRSAERVLRDELGVLAPSWLDDDVFLGP